VNNLSFLECLKAMKGLLKNDPKNSASVFFVNAHTLNTASRDPDYQTVLNDATHVFGDGIGVQWAAQLRGNGLKAKLSGTEIVPALLSGTQGYRCYLLGGTPDLIRRAADTVRRTYPGWEIAGFHHGYFDDDIAIVNRINAAKPHLLLVGMGNPIQEKWIHRNIERLEVPICMGVGGLFHYWSGDLSRARPWVCKYGFEWLGIMLQQPHKWRRYLLGNPAFLYRMAAYLYSDHVASKIPSAETADQSYRSVI